MNLIKFTFNLNGSVLPIYLPVNSLFNGGYFKPAAVSGSSWANSQIFLANGANLLVIETVDEIVALIDSLTATVSESKTTTPGVDVTPASV